MPILTLHGEYFVEGEKAVAETLFKPLNGKTASGHECYKLFLYVLPAYRWRIQRII